MRSQLEHVQPDSASSFRILEIRQAEFDAVWHHHPELELTLIHKGRGRRFVGNQIDNFCDGDLVLIGSGVPHFWRSEPGVAPWRAEATAIQFDPAALGIGPGGPRDLAAIRELVVAARYGVVFPSAEPVRDTLEPLRSARGYRRLTLLIEVLGRLAELGGDFRRPLSQEAISFGSGFPASADLRLNRALQRIFGHLTDGVTLDDAAEAAGMNRYAFCRFFHRTMGRGFSEFVNDSRVALACQQLRDRRDDIATIAFRSGFGTISNFNRVFKAHTGRTPTRFRQDSRRPTRH